MGKKAREIVGGDADRLIELLNKAYADEWIAYFYYKHIAKMIQGLESPAIASKIEETANEELEHVDELAERIIQLGGEPVKNFEEIVKTANCPKVNYPSNWGDLKGAVKAIIEAERCAIKVYKDLLDVLMKDIRDPVTFHIIRHILQEEVEHEDLFETILGEG